jgi:hypothetical protein
MFQTSMSYNYIAGLNLIIIIYDDLIVIFNIYLHSDLLCNIDIE